MKTFFMKSNKGLIIAVIAGITVAGIAGFLFGTDKGRRITKNMKEKKGEIFNQAADLFTGVKEKFTRKEEMKDKKMNKMFEEQFSEA